MLTGIHFKNTVRFKYEGSRKFYSFILCLMLELLFLRQQCYNVLQKIMIIQMINFSMSPQATWRMATTSSTYQPTIVSLLPIDCTLSLSDTSITDPQLHS